MLGYIEYLGLPISVAFVLAIIFVVAEGSEKILKAKEQIMSEVFNAKKRMTRKRKEKEALGKLVDLMDSLEQVPETLKNVNTLLSNVDKHYNSDNIAMRNSWMMGVDSNINEMRGWMERLDEKLDKNSSVTLSIRIDNMRTAIIDFASYVTKADSQVTREQFNRIFKMYEEYEDLISEHQLTNGEVDIAIRIIRESYENHLRSHNFIEDGWEM